MFWIKKNNYGGHIRVIRKVRQLGGENGQFGHNMRKEITKGNN